MIVNLSPCVPLPLGIGEGKGENLIKRGFASLSLSYFWGVKEGRQPQNIRGVLEGQSPKH